MSLATLKVTPLAGDTEQIVVDCQHGTTEILCLNGAAFRLTTTDVVRTALIRHHDEERCRCTRKLWREHFGCAWPEVPLARGAA